MRSLSPGPPARPVSLAALAAVAALLAGCGSSSSSSSGSAATSGHSVTAAANIRKLPPRLSVLLSPSGSVSVANSNGQPVTHLQSGRYTLSINVESASGDFRLTGPEVRRHTRPHFTGIVLWGVNFRRGTYRYQNDGAGPHPPVHAITVE